METPPEGSTVVSISGTQVRDKLSQGLPIEDWFSYPEVIDILRKAYRGQHGACIQFTGLSGSGKSTLAEALKAYIHETQLSKTCTILDGDVFREYFKDLGFDRESRSKQTRRIGFIASLIVKAGGIVVCANIAPYADDREAVRKLFPPNTFSEVYVETPIEECERRDPKGLYKKVRRGELKNFTGIDDPFEVPERPDLVLKTGGSVNATLSELVDFLKQRRLIS